MVFSVVKWPFFQFRTLPTRLFPWNTPEIGKKILNVSQGGKPARQHPRPWPKFQRDSFFVIKGHGSGAHRAKVPENGAKEKISGNLSFWLGEKRPPREPLPAEAFLPPHTATGAFW